MVSNTKEVKVYGKPRMRTDFPLPQCAGCHGPLLGKIISEVLEEMDLDGKTIAVAGVSCCAPGRLGDLAWDVMGGAHGPTVAEAVAIKRMRPDAFVIASAGDGEIGAIGIQYFMHAMLRGDKITTFMVNNACYAATGGQLAPTTLLGTVTTTSPYGRAADNEGYPLHAAELAAHIKGVAYSARVAVYSPAAFQSAKKCIKKAFQKQLDRVGFGFVEVVSGCPTNWGVQPTGLGKYIEEKMLPEYPLGVFKDVNSIA